MKTILLALFLPMGLTAVRAQQKTLSDTGIIGVYRTARGLSLTFQITRQDGKLILQIIGQGMTGLTPLSGLVYEPQHIRPRARMEFRKNDEGLIAGLRWTQENQTYTWKRSAGSPDGYPGDYWLPANPYRILHVREAGGKLWATFFDSTLEMLPVSKDRFVIRGPIGTHYISFKRDKKGAMQEFSWSGPDQLEFAKVADRVPVQSSRTNGFTRADSLLGKLSPLRTCYDVLFYDLDIAILPETKSVRGSNTIRFRAVQDFNRLQVDLHDNLSIDRIVFRGQELPYTRDCHAVFVSFPATVTAGTIDSLKIGYHGVPLEPDLSIRRGGILWLSSREKKIWIESVCQGVGANVWWPCKDHLSDRPDSMRISVTVPNGLTDISNGRLIGQVPLPDGQTKFVWYVDYPIVTYGVVVNIGDYVHFTDSYRGAGDSLNLNFYAMRYNLDYAQKFFAGTKRMLALYEKDFGPFPFPRDGYNVLESIYPMEHQGAISVGLMLIPYSGAREDSLGLLRTWWHESAHEWWGNSVGCSDYADMWIHESFASYAEFLNLIETDGRDAALKKMRAEGPDNKEPIIGVYGVNHFHEGDMYTKGALMLQTFRDMLQDDSVFFRIFRGIQSRFRYQPVRTEDIVDYINQVAGKDYTWFFDQYLRYPAIPVLDLGFQQDGERLRVTYQWVADVPAFRMPIKATIGKDRLDFIYPTTSPQTMELKGMTQNDFRVDRDEFYISVRRQ
jgi:hypothetical protein